MKKVISIFYLLLIFAIIILLLAAGIFEAVTEPWDGFFNTLSNLSAIVICTFFAFGYTVIAISKIKELFKKRNDDEEISK
jgi:hypothetical protein